MQFSDYSAWNPINTTTVRPKYFGRINEVVVLTGSSDEKNTLVLFGEMKSGRIIGVVVLTRWVYGGCITKTVGASSRQKKNVSDVANPTLSISRCKKRGSMF